MGKSKKLIMQLSSKHLNWLNILILILAVFVPSHSQNKVFKAGASLSNITPSMGMEILGGYNRPLANYIHDDLHVRSLVLNDGEVTLVFAIVDNVGVKQEIFDAAKSIIQNRLGIPASNVMLAATHTHSGVASEKQGLARKEYQYGKSSEKV